MKKLFFGFFLLIIFLVSCTPMLNEDAFAVETEESQLPKVQVEEESECDSTNIQVETGNEYTSNSNEHPKDGKIRIDLELSNITDRFPYSVLEGEIEIYYSDRVPQEMLDETISLINSTTDSKVISQIFLDTEYDPELDSSNLAYSFYRNIMYIVKWDDDPKYSMFNRYFYHELGHLLLGEYVYLNELSSEYEIPHAEDWVYFEFPDSLSEDFAKVYEYYRAWPEILDIYVDYDGIGPSVDIMKEIISSFN